MKNNFKAATPTKTLPTNTSLQSFPDILRQKGLSLPMVGSTSTNNNNNNIGGKIDISNILLPPMTATNTNLLSPSPIPGAGGVIPNNSFFIQQAALAVAVHQQQQQMQQYILKHIGALNELTQFKSNFANGGSNSSHYPLTPPPFIRSTTTLGHTPDKLYSRDNNNCPGGGGRLPIIQTCQSQYYKNCYSGGDDVGPGPGKRKYKIDGGKNTSGGTGSSTATSAVSAKIVAPNLFIPEHITSTNNRTLSSPTITCLKEGRKVDQFSPPSNHKNNKRCKQTGILDKNSKVVTQQHLFNNKKDVDIPRDLMIIVPKEDGDGGSSNTGKADDNLSSASINKIGVVAKADDSSSINRIATTAKADDSSSINRIAATAKADDNSSINRIVAAAKEDDNSSINRIAATAKADDNSSINRIASAAKADDPHSSCNNKNNHMIATAIASDDGREPIITAVAGAGKLASSVITPTTIATNVIVFNSPKMNSKNIGTAITTPHVISKNVQDSIPTSIPPITTNNNFFNELQHQIAVNISSATTLANSCSASQFHYHNNNYNMINVTKVLGKKFLNLPPLQAMANIPINVICSSSAFSLPASCTISNTVIKPQPPLPKPTCKAISGSPSTLAQPIALSSSSFNNNNNNRLLITTTTTTVSSPQSSALPIILRGDGDIPSSSIGAINTNSSNIPKLGITPLIDDHIELPGIANFSRRWQSSNEIIQGKPPLLPLQISTSTIMTSLIPATTPGASNVPPSSGLLSPRLPIPSIISDLKSCCYPTPTTVLTSLGAAAAAADTCHMMSFTNLLTADMPATPHHHPLTKSTGSNVIILNNAASYNNNNTLIDTTLGGIGKLMMSNLAGCSSPPPPPLISRMQEMSLPISGSISDHLTPRNMIIDLLPSPETTISRNSVTPCHDFPSQIYIPNDVTPTAVAAIPFTTTSLSPPPPIYTTLLSSSTNTYKGGPNILCPVPSTIPSIPSASTTVATTKRSYTRNPNSKYGGGRNFKKLSRPSLPRPSSIIGGSPTAATPAPFLPHNLRPLTALAANLTANGGTTAGFNNFLLHHQTGASLSGGGGTPQQQQQYFLFSPGGLGAGGGQIAQTSNLIYGGAMGQQFGFGQNYHLGSAGGTCGSNLAHHQSAASSPFNVIGYATAGPGGCNSTNNPLATLGQLAAAGGCSSGGGGGGLFFIAGNIPGPPSHHSSHVGGAPNNATGGILNLQHQTGQQNQFLIGGSNSGCHNNNNQSLIVPFNGAAAAVNHMVPTANLNAAYFPNLYFNTQYVPQPLTNSFKEEYNGSGSKAPAAILSSTTPKIVEIASTPPSPPLLLESLSPPPPSLQIDSVSRGAADRVVMPEEIRDETELMVVSSDERDLEHNISTNEVYPEKTLIPPLSRTLVASLPSPSKNYPTQYFNSHLITYPLSPPVPAKGEYYEEDAILNSFVNNSAKAIEDKASSQSECSDADDILVHFVEGHVIKESSFPLPLVKRSFRESLILKAGYKSSSEPSNAPPVSIIQIAGEKCNGTFDKDYSQAVTEIFPNKDNNSIHKDVKNQKILPPSLLNNDNAQKEKNSTQSNSNNNANNKFSFTSVIVKQPAYKNDTVLANSGKVENLAKVTRYRTGNATQIISNNNLISPENNITAALKRTSDSNVRTTITPNGNTQKFTNIMDWTVFDVYDFVSSLSGCSEYADTFRSNEIDGPALYLLKEEHLTTSLRMKLGPALKLQAKVAQLIKETTATSSSLSI